MKISFMDEDKLAPDQFLCGSDQAAAPPKKEARESFYCLSPVEHLREARNALKDGYRIDSDPVKTVWGRLNDAKRHLLAIDPHTPQYNTAKALVGEVTLRKR